MSVYESFFQGISPGNWEFFTEDFLISIGFQIIWRPSVGADDGVDLITEKSGDRYIVSCKHNIHSGKSVGTSVEQSILDRMAQHNANGFIGFYSTEITTSLSRRLRELEKQGYKIIIYDKSIISNYLPRISSHILQKYGLPIGIKFVLNVPEKEYTPLPCLSCGIDILDERMIYRSMALIWLNNDNILEYSYGCKSCFGNIIDRGWIEVSESLHQGRLNSWIKYVNWVLAEFPLSPNFYKHRSEYEGGIQQRMYPSNWGQWY